MKRFGSNLFGQAIKAASLSAALMLSASAGYAQSAAPFAFVSGITDRVGHFGDEVLPRPYAGRRT